MNAGASVIRFAVVLVGRLAALSVVWLVLVDGATSSWWIGGPLVLVVAVMPRKRPSFSIVWREIFRFIPFFMSRSVSGGIDVAWRALHPKRPLHPALIEYPLMLPPGLPQVVMANVVNLLPGTLTAELKVAALQVHVIDQRTSYFDELTAVEGAVARIFGVASRTA